MWKPTVESSSALIRLSRSFAPFSVCIPPDCRKAVAAVHSIGLSCKSYPFTRSACPWYLLIYSSNRTETVLAKLSLVLHFAAELLMLRCNHYLSDLICWMTLMGFKNDACPNLCLSQNTRCQPGVIRQEERTGKVEKWGALGLEPVTLKQNFLKVPSAIKINKYGGKRERKY